MRQVISFLVGTALSACSSSSDPHTGSVTSGATACSASAPLAGASYDLGKSRFAFGSKPALSMTGGLARWVGSDGVVAIWTDGSELASMNANAPEANLPDWSSDTAKLTQHVKDYWVSMGLVPCQVGTTSIFTTIGGGGMVGGPSTITVGSSTVTLQRAIDGVPVVESLADARFNSNDQTTEESFYWPEIPAAVVSAAVAFKNKLAEPGALAAYKAKLPTDAQGAGRVMIHHSSSGSTRPFQSAATYDVVQANAFGDGGDLNFDPDGNPITTIW